MIGRALVAALCVGAWGCGRDEALILVIADDAHPREGATETGAEAGAEAEAGAGIDLPPIPIGLDAYRHWDRLPQLRFGTRAYMRSTYDRRGGNEAVDASHFLRQEAEDRNVTLDVAGPGVLYFVRTNHWHGSPWHYVVDGSDHVVSESSTADPNAPVAGSIFLPEAAFPSPLTWTWSTTRGADLNWVPIPFEQTFTLAYGRTHYGTGYYIFHAFPEGATNLSQPIQSYALEPPGQDVLELLRRAGEDIAPTGGSVAVRQGSADVGSGVAVELFRLDDGPATLRALKFAISADQALEAAQARLRVTWDDRSLPSVDAPLALFFGTGSFYNREGAEYLVRALLTSVRFSTDDLELATYFPMPYRAAAKLEIVGGIAPLTNLRWHARTLPYAGAPNAVGYFHATYRDHGEPELGKDLIMLDTTEVEGGGDWCGNFVGTSFTFSDAAVLATLEGDPRFFFDDSLSPQAYGTGTEEWGGGGDYWGGRTMTLPLAGHPVGAPSPAAAQNAEDLIESAYRLLVADLMPFGKNARIQLEHGGTNESLEHYRSVAYWYGFPGACLVSTDSFHVGDPDDERTHGYVSPTASPPETLSSRYEWGVDRLGAVEVYPETTDTGRRMTGTSEFTLRLRPDNLGVLLRRKLDYSLPDQRAEVFIADDVPGAEFRRAGVWYLAGSNTCVYSNPPDELGPAEHVVQTSNRRFRDDEFLIARELTEGRSAIRLRIVHAPVPRPLYPGHPRAEQAWSEYRYEVYSYVLPDADPP